MINAIFISLLFIFSAIIQVSFVHTFDFPLALIPFHFLIGVVVLQKSGDTAGVLWFLTSAYILSLIGFSDGTWIAYWLAGIAGIILTKKVFTSHSVYGLEGLAISMYLIFFLVNSLNRFNDSLKEIIIDGTAGLVGLIIGIYFAFIIANGIEKLGQNILITRKNKKLV